MSNMKTYSLNAVRLVIGGYDLSGGGEDEFVSVEFPDMGSMLTGADGFKTFNGSLDKGATMTITVIPTSKAYENLCALCAAQRLVVKNGGQIGKLNVRLSDSSVGDILTSAYGAFTKEGSLTKGKSIKEVSFTLELANAQDGREPN